MLIQINDTMIINIKNAELISLHDEHIDVTIDCVVYHVTEDKAGALRDWLERNVVDLREA